MVTKGVIDGFIADVYREQGKKKKSSMWFTTDALEAVKEAREKKFDVSVLIRVGLMVCDLVYDEDGKNQNNQTISDGLSR